MSRIALGVVLACLWGCEVVVYEDGLTPPPLTPPQASHRLFEDRTLRVGESVVLLDVAPLFTGHAGLSYTTASSDTTVVTTAVDYAVQLTIRAVAPGTAEVSLTATEPPGRDPAGPQGRSATRTATVRVRGGQAALRSRIPNQNQPLPRPIWRYARLPADEGGGHLIPSEVWLWGAPMSSAKRVFAPVPWKRLGRGRDWFRFPPFEAIPPPFRYGQTELDPIGKNGRSCSPD